MIGNWGTISDHLSLKEVLKSVGIAALGQLHVYKLRKKPIFIFATRRGGSTLAMAMIASQPGVDFCSEPLTLWRAHPHFGLLPHPRRGCFVDLD